MRSYANAASFRRALEDRLRDVARQRGVQIQGLRLKVAIERLLARLFDGAAPPRPTPRPAQRPRRSRARLARSLRALPITETSLQAIAAAAMRGPWTPRRPNAAAGIASEL